MANLAAANVMHRKTRTAVSVLAVAMEVAMVMVLVGMANGTLGEIANRLENVGADVLFQPPDASFILGATSAVMPVKYIEIIKRDDGSTPEVGKRVAQELITRDKVNFLLGVMGPHTVSAGKIYFPAGVPDLTDIVDGKVDLASNVAREVAEETGLHPGDYDADAGWVCVRTGRRVAWMKRLRVHASAPDLRTRILAQLAREDAPELADIRIVRGPADLEATMPQFVTAYLEHMWSRTP